MKRSLFFSSLLSLILFCSACKKGPTTLNLLVWQGYAEPSFVQAFEQSHNCKISASYMGTSDELVAKLRGGSAANYDVISPSSDVAAMIVRSGLAEPLDLSKFSEYSKLSAKLRDSSLVKSNGKTYGVPFMWGPNPLLYDTTAFPAPPDSWTVLWDPKLKGKVSLWDELSSIYMAAQILGYDKPDPSHIYNLSDDELQAAKEKIARDKAEHPQVLERWGRTHRPIPKPRNRHRHGVAAEHRTTPQS